MTAHGLIVNEGTDVEFSAPMSLLFKPKSIKVFYGGRGAGRSWGCSRALLIMGAKRPIRVLCCRELQNSISESVHQILRDQISRLGLEHLYEIQVAKIIGKNGTIFSFEGIKNNTTKIKSYEGVDYCWVEEAGKVSKASWNILLPTIRKKGSEIWLTFNPELEEDYTYERFVLDPLLKEKSGIVDNKVIKWMESDDSIVVKMNFRDNPWFNTDTDLLPKLENDRKRDPEHYLNIWEGHCLQMLEGAVYARQLRAATEEGRICRVPWNREFPVDTFWDIGRADYTTIWFAQQVAMQIRVLGYFEDHLKDDVSYYLKECQRRGFTYGTMYLPHDAKAKRLGTKRTIEEQVKQAGYRTIIVPKLSLTDGINAARLVFPKCWFDQVECTDGLAGLRRYRYKVKEGQLSNEPEHNDAADAFRYLAVAIKGPRETKSKVRLALESAQKAVRDSFAKSSEPQRGSTHGWMR